MECRAARALLLSGMESGVRGVVMRKIVEVSSLTREMSRSSGWGKTAGMWMGRKVRQSSIWTVEDEEGDRGIVKPANIVGCGV